MWKEGDFVHIVSRVHALTLACAMGPDWPALLIFRFIMGIGATAPPTVLGGLFANTYPGAVNRGRAVMFVAFMTNLGSITPNRVRLCGGKRMEVDVLDQLNSDDYNLALLNIPSWLVYYLLRYQSIC